jgi:hypothetical protein
MGVKANFEGNHENTALGFQLRARHEANGALGKSMAIFSKEPDLGN